MVYVHLCECMEICIDNTLITSHTLATEALYIKIHDSICHLTITIQSNCHSAQIRLDVTIDVRIETICVEWK